MSRIPWSNLSFPRDFAYISFRKEIHLIFQSFIHLSTTFNLDLSHHAFPTFPLPDCITLPMQRHSFDFTTSDFGPTRCRHRLPKRDAGIQCVLLGSNSSKRWHGVLAEYMEPHNHHLQAGRALGKLFHARNGCHEQHHSRDTLRPDWNRRVPWAKYGSARVCIRGSQLRSRQHLG